MKLAQHSTILLIAIITVSAAGCAGGGTGQPTITANASAQSTPPPSTVRTIWEYKVEFRDETQQLDLAPLGKEGWELVTVNMFEANIRPNVRGIKRAYHFKRPK